MSHVIDLPVNALPKRLTASFSVCTFKGCSKDPMEGLDAPLCHPHAKMITAQVLAMHEPAPRFEPVKPPSKKLPVPGSVYIIQHGNRVKIGFSSNVKQRLCDLPYERIIAIIPGDRRLEHALLTKFKSIRTSGEWFEAHPELIAFAESLAAKAAA